MEFPKILFVTRALKSPGEYVDFHKHDETELVFYEKGSGETRIDGKKYEYSDGTIAVINSGVVHDETHYTDCNLIFFTIRGSDVNICDGVYKPNNFAILHKLAVQIYNETRLPRYRFNSLISAKGEELMILLARDIFANKHNNLEEIMHYIKDNCTQKLDIRQIADSYGIGYETLRHTFKEVYGMSPYSFAVYHRLQLAAELLAKSNKSCTETALECGFSDSAQFSKMFKAQFGISPRIYRKNAE